MWRLLQREQGTLDTLQRKLHRRIASFEAGLERGHCLAGVFDDCGGIFRTIFWRQSASHFVEELFVKLVGL